MDDEDKRKGEIPRMTARVNQQRAIGLLHGKEAFSSVASEPGVTTCYLY